MWILLMIVFSQPYHVATVDILGTYSEKSVCTSDQKRATNIPTPFKTSFGCVKIERVKRMERRSHEMGSSSKYSN
jgi:hypothetical protein